MVDRRTVGTPRPVPEVGYRESKCTRFAASVTHAYIVPLCSVPSLVPKGLPCVCPLFEGRENVHTLRGEMWG